MSAKSRFKFFYAFVAVIATAMLVSGCGSKQQGPKAAQTAVKAMTVVQKDAPVTFSYAGVIKSTNEVNVQARVTGAVVAKYVHGGESVTAGQPLYKIDDSTYVSALNQAHANLAQAQAQLSNAQQDLSRYAQLIGSGAISDQTYTNQQHTVAAYRAAVVANMAMVNKAQKDYDDTIVRSPVAGRLGLNDAAVGTYATAGNTTLVTVGSINPVFVQFNISEDEYLQFSHIFNGNFIGTKVELTLSDGTKYPLEGKIVEVDKQALASNMGTLTVKAIIANPDGLLLPGMFGNVSFTGETLKDAILVPQMAVQQMLGKSYVMLVGPEDKAVSAMVTLGPKIGAYEVISQGLKPEDKVIVEGLTSLREGMPLKVQMITPEEFQEIIAPKGAQAAQPEQKS